MEALCVDAVVDLDENLLRLVIIVVAAVLKRVGFGLQTARFCLNAADLRLGALAFGDRETVVDAVKIVCRRSIGARHGAASRKYYGRHGRKNQLFHNRVLFIYNV